MMFILSLGWAGKVQGGSPIELEQVFSNPFNQKTWPMAQICPEPRLWDNQASQMCFFKGGFPFTLSATLHIPAKFKPQWFGILTGVLRITIQNDYLKTFLKTKNAESCSNIYKLRHHPQTSTKEVHY